MYSVSLEGMDPNETLKSLRRIAAATITLADQEIPVPANYATDMAELFSALDQWLSRAGFIPEAWAVNFPKV